jgi:GT2 family glycosyltransferase
LISLGNCISDWPEGKPEFAVVIVTFNSAGVIGPCIESCRRFASEPVLVVDNASQDNTVEIARQLGTAVIANQTNRGFAAAVNQAVEQLDAECILLLNPDTQLLTSVENLYAECRRPGVGGATGALVDAGTGAPQTGFAVRRFPNASTLVCETLGLNRLFPGNPVNRRYRCADWDPALPGAVEQPAGAFMMFRRDVWLTLGGMDERFHPIWFEDVDFCKRLKDAGLEIRYRPEVRAAHEGGHSAGKLVSARRFQYWYIGLLRYAEKHFSQARFRLVSAAVLVRCVLKVIALRARRPFSNTPEIEMPLRFAVQGLTKGSLPKAGC